MKSLKPLARILLIGVALMLIIPGCYTKFYRPGMDLAGPYSTEELYSRYDSSAIDTTLTYEEVFPDYYPNDYGWYSWGMPRGYTRWGFDFYRFSPDYYHTYYGYYDYYGYPWWHRHRYSDPWWGGGNYKPGPTEPPSQRPGRRGREPYDGGGDSYGTPPAGGGGGSYAQPTQPQPQPQPETIRDRKAPPAPKKQPDHSQKRNGKRRR